MKLSQALPQGRPVAVWHDQENIRYLLDIDTAVREFSLPASAWQSYAAEYPSLDWFERAIWESSGVVPGGHPNLRPVRRFDRPYTFASWPDPQVHEVAVGPVHAGIIEPGHFRFSVLGEKILNLEIRLGYQHRGLEALLVGKTPDQAVLLAERAGSEPVAHALAFCQAIEKIARVEIPPRAQVLRLVYLELERIFQHLGHLVGLFSDIGYSWAQTQTGKVRALMQGLLERLCGHRYGRNTLRVGGLWVEPDQGTVYSVREALVPLAAEAAEVLIYALDNPMLLDRMRYIGQVPEATARALGMVGPAARASGIPQDLRQGQPYYAAFNPVVKGGGDVLARAQVYTEETAQSFKLVDEWLETLPEGYVYNSAPLKEGEAWSRLEAPRGEVFYWLRLHGGQVQSCRIVDPSFKNWRGLEVAVQGQGLPDFPLCNKSFDLSYAGSDL